MSKDFREQAIEAMARAMFDRHEISNEFSFDNRTNRLFIEDARIHLDALAAFMERENVKALTRDIVFSKADGKTAPTVQMHGPLPDIWTLFYDEMPCLLQPTEATDG